MGFDYFSGFSEYIVSDYYRKPADTDWAALLSWLGDAPAQAPDSAITTWTKMVHATVGKETGVAPNASRVVAGLRGYYDRLLTIPDQEFLRVVQMQVFVDILRALMPQKEHAHTTMRGLVKDGWNPVPLMERFNQLRPLFLEKYREHAGFNVSMVNTCMGTFLKTLEPLLWEGTWTPTPHAAYGLLFETYEITFDDNPKPDTQFIRNTTLATVGQSYKALRFAQHQDVLQFEHLAAMFPLSLTKEEPLLFLDALVGLVLREPTLVKGKTMELLKQHHPQLAGLVSMHCSLFPEATRQNTKVELLVGPYLTMLDMHVHGATHETIDSSVFETASHDR